MWIPLCPYLHILPGGSPSGAKLTQSLPPRLSRKRGGTASGFRFAALPVAICKDHMIRACLHPVDLRADVHLTLLPFLVFFTITISS